MVILMLVRYLRPSRLHPVDCKQICAFAMFLISTNGFYSVFLQKKKRDDTELVAIAVPPTRQFEWEE